MRRLVPLITVVVALGFAGAAQAATPTFVQGTAASSTGTTLSQSYASNVTGGSLLVGIFRAQAGTTVSDSLNGAWTEAPGPLAPNSIWYKANAAAGADTVTVKSTTSGSLRMVFAEYSNVLATAPLVSSGCATGTGATVTTPSIASAAGDLMFGGVGIGNTPITVSSSNLRSQFTNATGTSADADLISTGSPQSVTFGLSSSPALGWSSCAADFKPSASADTTSPSMPTNLFATPGDGTADLTWTASTDNVGVVGYHIYRDGVLLTSVSGTTFHDSGLTNDTHTYVYEVAAYDAAGNESQHASVAVTPHASSSLIFDGTFSPTDPNHGPHWNQAYGNCYSYTAANELTFHITSACNPAGNGHYRTDVCTGGPSSCSATSGIDPYVKNGAAVCTSVPFDLPQTIPAGGGNSWFQIAEMKDSSSSGGDWTMSVASSGGSHLAVGFTGGVYHNTDAWRSSGPAPTGWHTLSLCQDGAGTSAQAWLDGSQLTFNIGSCSGSITCTGLNLYYDGFAKQPLDINAYTGNTSGSDPYTNDTIIHGDPLISAGSAPPEQPGGWNSP